MNWLKCSCGCDKLSKEELESLIHSSDRIRDFLNNQTARDMFRRMFYPDEPDMYTSQPSGSKNHPVGKAPKPNAIKHLECIEEAQLLLQADDLSDAVVEEFAERVPDMELGDRLYESTDTNRAEALEAIVTEYGHRLSETKEFKQFRRKLTQAYEGKLRIEKR